VIKLFLTHRGTVVYYLFACLGEMEPARESCILQSQSQVIVSPKYRVLSESAVSESVKHELARADVGDSETLADMSSDDVHNISEVTLSPMDRLVAGFRRFLFGSETDVGTDDIAESVTYKSETWNIKTKLFCRILPLENFTVDKLKSNSNGSTQQIIDADSGCGNDLTLSCSDLSFESPDLLQQPTNVYVGIFTILSQLPAVSLDSVPNTFLAMLSRLRSPSEELAASRIQRAKSAHSGSEDLKESDSVANERKIVVRVIVVNFNSESRASGLRFKQPVPQKHILLSSLLRRQMNMSAVTGKVALNPLCISSDICPAKIKVFPLFSIVSCTYFVYYCMNRLIFMI